VNKDEFTRAFALGFMVTREGFNFECPSGNSPRIVESNPTEFYMCIDFSGRDYQRAIEIIENDDDFVQLRDKAFEVFSSNSLQELADQFGIKVE